MPAHTAATIAKAAVAVYKKQVTAEAKTERTILTAEVAAQRQAIAAQIAATTDPVAKAQLRVQLAAIGQEAKAARAQIAGTAAFDKANALTIVGAGGNIVSTYVTPSGTLAILSQDANGQYTLTVQ